MLLVRILFAVCCILKWSSLTRVVRQEILKAPQTALYYKGIVVILNSVHPMCFWEDVVIECWCCNDFLCRGGTFVVLNNGGKKWLVLGVLAEPSGSGSHVLLLTFFIWLRGKTVFDLRCGEAGRQLGFGPNQQETELKWRSWQSQGWWRSRHTLEHISRNINYKRTPVI